MLTQILILLPLFLHLPYLPSRDVISNFPGGARMPTHEIGGFNISKLDSTSSLPIPTADEDIIRGKQINKQRMQVWPPLSVGFFEK